MLGTMAGVFVALAYITLALHSHANAATDSAVWQNLPNRARVVSWPR
ncbi:exported hypothetical protein [Paraburkholderia piptadeniae]|uniref:Uncharacterized protein n=1 Tax=Paraburkholderia piptadeniae TaxID=1701573 RepID=A0A1N7SL11_9BURK|nr:exported hypothetical protein [Paraburkholderia piptadeniae]